MKGDVYSSLSSAPQNSRLNRLFDFKSIEICITSISEIKPADDDQFSEKMPHSFGFFLEIYLVWSLYVGREKDKESNKADANCEKQRN